MDIQYLLWLQDLRLMAGPGVETLWGGFFKMFLSLITAAFLAPALSRAIEKRFLANR